MGNSRARVGVDHREIELGFGGVQVNEKVVDLVEDFGDARILPVNLVDDYDGWEPRLQRFHQHVAGLRQRARCHQRLAMPLHIQLVWDC